MHYGLHLAVSSADFVRNHRAPSDLHGSVSGTESMNPVFLILLAAGIVWLLVFVARSCWRGWADRVVIREMHALQPTQERLERAIHDAKPRLPKGVSRLPLPTDAYPPPTQRKPRAPSPRRRRRYGGYRRRR